VRKLSNTCINCCRRAARDGNGGAKLSLDHFVAAVLKIKYEYETELHTNSCLLADSRSGNKSLKLIPHNPLRQGRLRLLYGIRLAPPLCQ